MGLFSKFFKRDQPNFVFSSDDVAGHRHPPMRDKYIEPLPEPMSAGTYMLTVTAGGGGGSGGNVAETVVEMPMVVRPTDVVAEECEDLAGGLLKALDECQEIVDRLPRFKELIDGNDKRVFSLGEDHSEIAIPEDFSRAIKIKQVLGALAVVEQAMAAYKEIVDEVVVSFRDYKPEPAVTEQTLGEALEAAIERARPHAEKRAAERDAEVAAFMAREYGGTDVRTIVKPIPSLYDHPQSLVEELLAADKDDEELVHVAEVAAELDAAHATNSLGAPAPQAPTGSEDPPAPQSPPSRSEPLT